MKFFFGILHCSTQSFMIRRSCVRTRSIMTRMLLTVVKLLRHRAELFEYFRQFQDLFLSGSVTATFRFDGVTRYNVLSAQFRKFFTSQFRVDAVVIIGAVVIAIFFVFIFVIVQIFTGKLRTDVVAVGARSSSAFGSTKPVIRSDRRASSASTRSYCSSR